MINNPVFLYVEDDLKSIKVIDIIIRQILGYENIQFFEDSENFKANLLALDEQPNLIFLDIQIAPLNGYEMLDILRAMPEHKNTTIIAMTANVMSNDVDALKKSGFSGLIGKPIIQESFPQLIAQILAGEEVWFVP